jgi:hypothetical protein
MPIDHDPHGVRPRSSLVDLQGTQQTDGRFRQALVTSTGEKLGHRCIRQTAEPAVDLFEDSSLAQAGDRLRAHLSCRGRALIPVPSGEPEGGSILLSLVGMDT